MTRDELITLAKELDAAGALTQDERAGLIEQGILDAKGGKRGMGGEFVRQLGLTVRQGVEGLATLPAMIADSLIAGPVNSLAKAAGREPPFKQGAMGAVSGGLTAAGLPQEENPTERVVGRVSRGIAGIGSTAGLGQMVAGMSAATPMAQAAGRFFATDLGTQATGSIGGATAGGIAHEMGASPAVEMAAELAGGYAAPAAVGMAKAGGRALKAGARAMTAKGQEKIAGRLLRGQSSTPQASAARLAGLNPDDLPDDPKLANEAILAAVEKGPSHELIPGSKPTMGEVAQDYGLIMTQRNLEDMRPEAFAAQRAAQAQSRVDSLRRAGATDNTVASLTAKRSMSAKRKLSASTEQALQAGKRINVAPLRDKIGAMAADPHNQSLEVRQSFDWMLKQLDVGDDVDPVTLYERVKSFNPKAIAADASANPAKGSQMAKAAAGAIRRVRNMAYEAIDEAAPGFREYLDDFSKRSKVIDSKRVLLDLISDKRGGTSAMNSGVNAAGDAVEMSAAKLSGVLANDAIRKKLMPNDLALARRVMADIRRESSLKSPFTRPRAGSDTAQRLKNLNGAELLGAVLGRRVTGDNPVAAAAQHALGWAWRVPNEKLVDLLTRAAADPKLAAKLMAQVTTPDDVWSISDALIKKAVATGIAVTHSTSGTSVDFPD